MQLVTRSFSPLQLSQVTKANNDRDLLFACPANFNGRSNCFAAITFKTPDAFRPADAVQYLIRIDAGSKYVNVDKHTSDFETRVLPLQWVLDSVSEYKYFYSAVAHILKGFFRLLLNCRRV